MPQQIKRKPPQQFTVECCDEPIWVRSVSAMTMTKLENRFPINPETSERQDPYGYFAAIMNEAIVTGPEGGKLWSEEEIRNMDSGYFWDLWNVVGTYTGIKRKSGAEKNSPPASGSPTVSPPS